MSAPGPVKVLLDTPMWQVFAQPWPVTDAEDRWAWGVASRLWPGFVLEGAAIGLTYYLGTARRPLWTIALPAAKARRVRATKDWVQLAWPPNSHGLLLSWTAWASPGGPLLWRLQVENHGPHPVRLVRWTLLRVGPARPLRRGVFGRVAGAVSHFGQRTDAPEMTHPGALRLHDAAGALAFYAHAWASWGHTRVYFDHERRAQARYALDRLLPPRHDPAAPRPRGPNRFYSDLFGVLADRDHRRGLLLGFAGQRYYYGGLSVRLDRLEPHAHLLALGDETRLDPGASTHTDWAVLWLFDLDDPDAFTPYLRTVTPPRTLPERREPPTGWLSWYEYFREVTAAQVRANADAARDLAERGVRLQVVQVDDGYAAVPGTWGPPLRADFGNNLAALAEDVRARGFRPGVWQAPFIAHRKAAPQLRRLLRRGRWGPVFAGWVWNTLTFGLDASHPEALTRAVDMARKAAQQGFKYLKLDFLYAGALPGSRRDPTRSRAEALYVALQAVVRAFRQYAGPEATVLLCGVPLGTAVGLADTVRIGPDVDPRWQMHHPLAAVRRHPDVPGLGNALRGVLMRMWARDIWWLADPDPLLPTSPHLTPAEQEAWHTIVALVGGAWFVSADLTRLRPDALERLQRVFPRLRAERVWVPDLWDAYPPRRVRADLDGPAGLTHVLVLLNWDETPARVTVRPADFGLDPTATYWVRRFWHPEAPFLVPSQGQWEVTLPSHGAGVWAVRLRWSAPQFVGSDLHVGQGANLRTWHVWGSRLFFTLALPGPRRGRVWLTLPAAPKQVQVNDQPATWHAASPDGLYALDLAFTDRAEVVVTW